MRKHVYMKKVGKAITPFLIILLFFAGCDLNSSDSDGDTVTYTGEKVKSGTTTTYHYLFIDLEDPENPVEVTGGDDLSTITEGSNTNWEIMITAQKEILTNSGVTATSLSSSGQGGVVYAETSNFDASISIPEAQALFAADSNDYSSDGNGKDYSYYDKYKTTSAEPTEPTTGNAISYPGYAYNDSYPQTPERNGRTTSTAWIFSEDVNFSLGRAYAEWERMAPNYSNFTNNLYIVRSGDGSSYYKLQILDAEYVKAKSESQTSYKYIYKVRTAQIQ
ncbi:hypothetical protein [Sediminispirochaeta bajacaliforniensis]|uniref:hypothetical protein n=1 Tax=Sediminispirochaeta bajacaliforniensis TaxID=148 RepID=UPI0003699060|nr:hypothetical protein [Sediminispirochaeta bajacaliforniensis]